MQYFCNAPSANAGSFSPGLARRTQRDPRLNQSLAHFAACEHAHAWQFLRQTGHGEIESPRSCMSESHEQIQGQVDGPQTQRTSQHSELQINGSMPTCFEAAFSWVGEDQDSESRGEEP